MACFSERLLTPVLAILGLVLMATPLALWVAWSGTLLFAVLIVGAAAGLLYCLLARFEGPRPPARRETGDARRDEGLPAAVVDDLQALHPFVHHNRLSQTPEVRRALRRLMTHLYG